MYFKFRDIDSRDMGVTVLTRPNIISPEMRTWTTFIDGKDGAYSHPMGLKPNSFSFTIAVEDVENIDKVLGWLTGRGRFIRSDLPNRYLNVHINEGVRLHRTVEWLYQGEVTVQVVDPFWYSVKDEWQEYKPNLIKNGLRGLRVYGREGKERLAPLDVFQEDYNENLLMKSHDERYGDGYGVSNWYFTEPMVDGEMYTVSFEYKVEGSGGTKNRFGIYNSGGSDRLHRGGYDNTRTEWTKYTASFVGKVAGVNSYLRIYNGPREEKGGVHIRKIKLEKGIKSTPWVPAWSEHHYSNLVVSAWDNMYYHIEEYPDGTHRVRIKGGPHTLKAYIPLETPKEGELVSTTYQVVRTKYPLIISNQQESVSVIPGEEGKPRVLRFKGNNRTNHQARIETNKVGDSVDVITKVPIVTDGWNGVLANEGNYPSKPIIKLVKGEGKSVTIKTKDSYLTYTFPNRETEVEIDTTTKTATYNGETRDRFVETDAVEVEFPPGPIDIQVEGGTAYFKKKDRWI